MHYIIVLALVLSFTSCTNKTESVGEPVTTIASLVSSDSVQQDLSQNKMQDHKFKVENEFLDYLRFAGSVEMEIFKIVDLKFKETEKIPSQLRILSQLLDLKFNKKVVSRSSSIFYNCNKVEIQNISDQEFNILRTCERKPQVIAKIKRDSINLYQVSFIQSEWQTVIGDSAMLNQRDKVCQLVISNKKVFEVSCDNTLITIETGAQLEEIKLHRFKFDRAAQNQIVVTGGRYKDFLERSKINIVVPDEGKIKFKEEELAVRDDYAEPVTPPKPTVQAKDFVPPAPKLTEDGEPVTPLNELDMNNPQVEPQAQPPLPSTPPQPTGR
jgi:hypothetical protein